MLPFPRHYRIGNVYSMIVFKLNIEEFEYAYRVDGPYDPGKGLIFDRTKYLLEDDITAGSLCKGSHRTEPVGGFFTGGAAL